jgi:hypothetical protein
MDQSESPPPPDRDPQPRQAGFLHVLGAVFSSFLGIRKRSAGERDVGTIKPVHVIVAGLLGAAFLVAVMITIVAFVTRAG